MTQKEPKESARYILEEMANERLAKGFRFIQHLVYIKSKNIIVFFIEYYNILQDKTVVLILQNNLYTSNYIEEWIQMDEVIPEVDIYVEKGYILQTTDYKKYISHDYDDL